MSMVDKPTVRVVINVTGLPNTYKETHSDNTVTYNGLFYDVYQKIKQALGENIPLLRLMTKSLVLHKLLTTFGMESTI